MNKSLNGALNEIKINIYRKLSMFNSDMYKKLLFGLDNKKTFMPGDGFGFIAKRNVSGSLSGYGSAPRQVGFKFIQEEPDTVTIEPPPYLTPPEMIY
jgi:hypothetical protein